MLVTVIFLHPLSAASAYKYCILFVSTFFSSKPHHYDWAAKLPSFYTVLIQQLNITFLPLIALF
jgi:hypothetical protein